MKDTQVIFDALRTSARLLQAALDEAAHPRSQRLLQAAIELRDTVEDIASTVTLQGFERQGLARRLEEFDRTLLHAPILTTLPLSAHGGDEPQTAAISAG